MIVQQVNKNNFAKAAKPNIDGELGTSGSSLWDMFSKQDQKKQGKIKITDLRYMKDNDGTVKSLYQILRMPIMANTWRIDADGEAEESQKKAAEEQAEFIQRNFTKPPHKGGMSTPFRLVIARTLKAILEGYALAEKVLTLNDEGKIVYRKIAFRDVCKISILTDEKGGFAGYNQKYWSKTENKFIDVDVPVDYCFLYTYNKDEDEIYGQSAFQSAFYHWDRKRRLYYLYEQAVEKGAMPPKMLEVQEGNEDTDATKSANLAAMTNFGIDSAVLVPTGYKLSPYDSGKGRLDPMPGIDHHDAQMARSVLAQFILLGNSDKTGSFALSKSHADIFMMALRGTMAEVEEHYNSYLIPQLIDYNFETAYYPEFRFNDMSDDTQEFIESIFTELVKTPGNVSKEFIDGLVKRVAERLDIDLTELEESDKNEDEEEVVLQPDEQAVVVETEEIAKTALNGAQIASLLTIVTQIVTGQLPFDTGRAVIEASFPTLAADDIDAILDPAKTFVPTALARLKKKVHRYATGDVKWRRDLFPAESNISLAAIEDKMNTQEEKFVKAMKDPFDAVTAQLLADIEPIIESGDITKLDGLTIKDSEQYAATIAGESLATYNAGKQITSDDLEVKIPTTPKETKDYFKQNAKSVAEKQLSDLLFKTKSTVTAEFHKGQLSKKHTFSFDDVKNILLGDFDGFFNQAIGITGSIVVSQAINRARDDVFSTAEEDIAVYQYSAILDSNTCELCESLDGTVVDGVEYAATPYQPPEHQYCRCIWIAIKKDQTEIPDLTGIPDISEEVVSQNQTL
jgi:phage gp29-like protein